MLKNAIKEYKFNANLVKNNQTHKKKPGNTYICNYMFPQIKYIHL